MNYQSGVNEAFSNHEFLRKFAIMAFDLEAFSSTGDM